MNTENISSSIFDGQAPIEVAPIATEAPIVVPEVIAPVVAEPVVVAPVVDAPFDPKVIFGESYDTIDKVKADFDRLQLELSDLRKREPEFANDDIKFMNAAIKAGIPSDQIDLVKGFKSGTMSDAKDLVSAQLRMQYGWSKEKTDLYMDKTYKVGEDYDVDDPDVQMARMQLDMSAEIAKTYLSDKTSKINVSEGGSNVEALIQQQQEAWNPIIPEMMNKHSVVKIAEGIEYTVPKETLEQAQKLVSDVLGSDIFDVKDQRVREDLEAIVHKEVVYREFNNIVKHLNVEYEKKAIKEKANVPPVGGSQAVPSSNQELDNLRSILTQMAENR